MPDMKLLLGDCLSPLTGLPSLPDLSVDHFIFDPPYSRHVHGNHWADYTRRNPTHHDARSDAVIDFGCMTMETMEALAVQIERLCRRWVIVFCDDESTFFWRGALEDAGLKFVRTGHWVKSDPPPQFSGDRPGSAHESIVIAHRRGRKRWNGRGRSNVWMYASKEPGIRRLHPTQKPQRLMERLVLDFTDTGELVCDPFAGSGSTAAACKRWARGFLGWEADPSYHDSASKRIQAVECQIDDFDSATAGRPRRAVQLGLPLLEALGTFSAR